MDKKTAIDLLGGSMKSAAKAIGISYRAVHKWPEQLPPRISDRVIAAQLRVGMRSMDAAKKVSR